MSPSFFISFADTKLDNICSVELFHGVLMVVLISVKAYYPPEMDYLKSCYILCMTLLEAYRKQMDLCWDKGIEYENDGHYQTRIDFKGERVYVSPDGTDVVRNVFEITGCVKSRKIIKNGKVVKTVHFHKDRLPVYGRITNKKRLRGFLFKYLLFLRCDEIEQPELMKLYLLHLLRNKFEFWRKKKTYQKAGEQIVEEYKDWEMYQPEYEDIAKMIDGLIVSAKNNPLDDETRKQFIVRSRDVVNPIVYCEDGTFRDKRNNEKHRDAHHGQKIATDNKIRANYDPALTDKENAQKIGVCISRLREWKAENRESLESLEEKIARLYDRNLSYRENADIIGCSVNSIRKYADTTKDDVVEAGVESEDQWLDDILKEEDAFWKDEPKPVKKKRDIVMEEELEYLLSEIDKEDMDFEFDK